MKYIVIIFFGLLFGCKKNSTTKNLGKNKELSEIYILKDKDSINIGRVFVSYIENEIFDYLYVINKKDTIYFIKKNILGNRKGKDIELYSKNFYGYKFVLKKNDYFILSGLGNKGKDISDNINIEWNYEKKILEVLKLP
jgi:hypothetical protein